MTSDDEILALLSYMFRIRFGNKNDLKNDHYDRRNYKIYLEGLAAGKKFRIITATTVIEFDVLKNKKTSTLKIKSKNALEATKLQTFIESLKISESIMRFYTESR